MGDLVAKAASLAIFGIVVSSSWFFLPAGLENVSAFSRQISKLRCSEKEPCKVQFIENKGREHFLVTRYDGKKTVSFTVTTRGLEESSEVMILRRYDDVTVVSESEIDLDDKTFEWLESAKAFDCDELACNGYMTHGEFSFGKS